ALGASDLIITGNCEAITPGWAVGDLALITDHINLLGDNPLVGPNDDSLGPRFPDMSAGYTSELAAAARERAAAQGVTLRNAVYAAVPGPVRPTDAECRMLRIAQADVVGMSMVPETIVAVHGGMRVLGVAVVQAIRTDATGDETLAEHSGLTKAALSG